MLDQVGMVVFADPLNGGVWEESPTMCYVLVALLCSNSPAALAWDTQTGRRL
jgi:hypothetical protein